MKKKISILLGGLLAVAMVFGAISVNTAYAQAGTTATPTAQTVTQPVDGHGHGQRGLGDPELAAAAKVDIQDVKDAINAVHAEEMRAQIAQAVTDGTMTQARADWLLEGLDKGYLDGPDSFGFDSLHGHGGHPDKQSDTTIVPTTAP